MIKKNKNNVIFIFLNIILLSLFTSFYVMKLSFAIVLSDSMNPTFKAGDLILSKTVGTNPIEVGEIVTYQDGTGKRITHRVVEINNDYVLTKGDAISLGVYERVPIENLTNIYIGYIPYGGYLIKWISSPVGFVLFFNFPLCYIVFVLVRKSLLLNKKTYKRYKPQEY